MRAVLVPASQEVHDTIFRADDREQKCVTRDAERLTSIEAGREKGGDGSDEVRKAATGMWSEDEKYNKAREVILEYIEAHHPDKYEQFSLQLEGYSRSKVAEMTGKNTSTLYKMGARMARELEDILYSLDYLEIRTYRRKGNRRA